MTFHCRATGSNALWNINHQNFNSSNRTLEGYVFSEVVQSQADEPIYDMFLEVPTTLRYNNTRIRCGVLEDISEPALLIIQGKL